MSNVEILVEKLYEKKFNSAFAKMERLIKDLDAINGYIVKLDKEKNDKISLINEKYKKLIGDQNLVSHEVAMIALKQEYAQDLIKCEQKRSKKISRTLNKLKKSDIDNIKKEILQFISSIDNGFTVSEIVKHLSSTDKIVVKHGLKKLVKSGVVTINGDKTRKCRYFVKKSEQPPAGDSSATSGDIA